VLQHREVGVGGGRSTAGAGGQHNRR
jgi:hypothetical protein